MISFKSKAGTSAALTVPVNAAAAKYNATAGRSRGRVGEGEEREDIQVVVVQAEG